ncbi:MAG TPA: chromosome segregation protein SMC [Candidatus Acidoferrales bacterium]|nr:chromosome segregation protein SMC [Candidatus Acidoferrales bacterium]
MRLKTLEMVGFKSFSERTSLDFTANITAVVGPNGCGKSNIVDALRWVMGEQSPRHLRGQQMEDVIFNGSEGVPPTGMAEVSVILDNEDGRGPVEYGNLSEIMITRRLFRSGESEYLINKVPCRLKDITDLFLGTGVGNKAYSIVEQGRVEEIVNAKPEERRLLIEEAAGTSKYKSRKAAAERKLERTEQNLTRVTDILSEIERQIKSMELQAKKAERFKALREELKQKELHLGGLQAGALESQVAAHAAQLAAAEDRLIGLVAALRAQEAESESVRAALLDREKQAERLQEEVFQQRMRVQAAEQEIAFAAKELEQNVAQAVRSQAELEEMREREKALRAASEEIARAREHLRELALVEEGSLRAAESQVGELKSRIHTLQAEVDRRRGNLIDLLNELAHLANQHQAKNKRREELVRELAKNGGEKARWLAAEALWRERARERGQALEALRAEERDTAAARAEVARRLKELSAIRDQRGQRVEALKERLQEARSKWASLEELHRNYEGLQEGVRAIMLKRAREEAFGGVCGLVAEVIESSADYEKALSAVLGDRLQYVIVQSHDEGMQAIDYLKREAAGRGSFIPRSVSRWERRALPLGEPEVVAPLLEKVSVKEGYEEVAEFLLGDVVVVQDLKAGLELWRRNGFVNTLVTPDGEVIDPVGIVSGGSAHNLEGNLLSQRRVLRELEGALGDIGVELERETRELQTLQQSIDAEAARQAELDDKLRRLELERVGVERDVKEAERELGRCQESIHLFGRERDDLCQLLVALEREIAETSRAIERQNEQKKEHEADLAAQQQSLGELENELERLEARATQCRVRAAALGEKKENADLNLQNHLALQRELSGQIRSREDELLNLAEKRSALERALESRRSFVESARRVLADLERALEEQRTVHRELSRRAGALENAAAELRAEMERAQDEKNRHQLVLSEKRLSLEHLRDNLREKYGVEPTPASETEPSPDSLEALAEEIRDLRARLERMGEVNLAAIGEFEDLRDRYEFLDAQRRDLEKSIADLRQVIAKLNRVCRQRFRESFEEINEKFQDVFQRLFRGGKAKLVLTDESDYLETGVDIVAQPPGKKLQSIILLSGGEKALTAVSLLFGIFLTKPTPFCVLDEVDAPLDDANIDRFNELVREMSQTSQFVLITHNKRTMQSAQVLYGVTMAEPGVSRVVSVRMN